MSPWQGQKPGLVIDDHTLVLARIIDWPAAGLSSAGGRAGHELCISWDVCLKTLPSGDATGGRSPTTVTALRPPGW